MKKINLIIDSCSRCPYCQYDPNYGMSYDSGYDCNHKGGTRIVDDWYYNSDKAKEYKSGIPVPDWCPLEDVTRKDKLEKIINKIKVAQ